MNIPKAIYISKKNDYTFVIEDFEDNQTSHVHIFKQKKYIRDYQYDNEKSCKKHIENEYNIQPESWNKITNFDKNMVSSFYAEII
jgi:hypothetical protein